MSFDSFQRLARWLQAGDIDFSLNGPGDSEGPELDVEKLIADKPLADANSVSSRGVNSRGTPTGHHKVVLDIDHDAALWETSTPGHHHLIIDHDMTWQQYEKLMSVMRDVGLIQDGYYRASVARKASWIRTPWTKKEVTQ